MGDHLLPDFLKALVGRAIVKVKAIIQHGKTVLVRLRQAVDELAGGFIEP